MSFVEEHQRHCRLAVVMVVEKTAACLRAVADFGVYHLHVVPAASIDVEMPMRGLTRKCQKLLEIVSAAKLLAS